SHLHRVGRMALRNQRQPSERWAKRSTGSSSDRDEMATADVAPGVPSAPAADFLLAHLLRRLPEAHGELQRYIHHVARYGTEDNVRPLVEFARNNGPGDLLRQAALFKAIQQGTQERGGKLRSETRRWAEELAQKLVASERRDYVV